jgi:hypothetical protein
MTTQKSLIPIGNGTIIPHYTDYAMPADNVFQPTVKSLYQRAENLCKNLIITTHTPSKPMQRHKKIIVHKHGTKMKHKYLTNFMMFTDLLIQPTQLVTSFTGNRYTCLCSSFSLYSHFKNMFLRLYVISVTLVEDFKAIRRSNKKNASSTKAALDTMCTNSTKDCIRVVKCMTFL